MKIKFIPVKLLTAGGLAFIANHLIITRGAWSIPIALASLIGLITEPFRLALSLFAALGSGITLRGWAALEFEMWRLRRKGELFSRQQYMTYRRSHSPAIVLGLINLERQIIEGTNDQALILIGGAGQCKDIFLSGASLDEVLRSQR